MNTHDDQRLSPAYSQETSSAAPEKSMQISPAAYSGLLVAIILLSILFLTAVGYIVWSHRSRRKLTRGKLANANLKHDVEKGTKPHLPIPETPDTVFGIDASKFHKVELNRDNTSSQDSQSPYNNYKGQPLRIFVSSSDGENTPATPAPSLAGSPMIHGENTIGDRLRSHLMVRESTGGYPSSTDPNIAAALLLGAEHVLVERSLSRSSLYTITEAQTEECSSNSPEPLSPTTITGAIPLHRDSQ